MEIFYLTLNQMMVLFLLILAGFFLKKKNVFADNTGTMMSRLETYIFLPALNFSNMATNCTASTFIENSKLILYGVTITVAVLCLAYPLSRLFVRNSKGNQKLEEKRNVYKYALTFGNYGFMGNAIILGVFGSEMLFKYNMFNLISSMICTGWGMYVLTPKDNSANPVLRIAKSLCKPPIISLLLGLVFGLLNLTQYIPGFIMNTLSSASDCMGPVAMILAGVVIGSYDIKKLFSDARVYILAALRLVLIPAVIAGILMVLGTSDEIITLALIAFATPIGLNTIVYPAAYGGDTKPGASMAIISNPLAVATIPLMYLVFVVIL